MPVILGVVPGVEGRPLHGGYGPAGTKKDAIVRPADEMLGPVSTAGLPPNCNLPQKTRLPGSKPTEPFRSKCGSGRGHLATRRPPLRPSSVGSSTTRTGETLQRFPSPRTRSRRRSAIPRRTSEAT